MIQEGSERMVPYWLRTVGVVSILLTCGLNMSWGFTWEDIRKNAATIHSIHANFIQEKHLKILAKPLISRGSFYFQMPDALRWEYTSPIRSILLLYNGKVNRYIEGRNGLTRDDTAQLQSMQVVLGEISRWLNGHFDDNPQFSPSLVSGNRIILSPKEKSLSQIIARIEIQLSDIPGIFDSVTIYESEDSFTRLTFQHPVLNAQINERRFQEIE